MAKIVFWKISTQCLPYIKGIDEGGRLRLVPGARRQRLESALEEFRRKSAGPCRVQTETVVSQTRTDSVQKVCGGVWQGFDYLTKFESSKVEVSLQGGLKSSSTYNH